MSIGKKQLAVITVLNLVIVALVCTIFYLGRPISNAERPDNTPPQTDEAVAKPIDPPPHNKLRAATAGRVKEISRETRLMGSGDESVILAHGMGGVTYIFGNAVVGDYDFDGTGGFLCRLSDAGTILGFTYFSGRLTAAAVAEGGFCVATADGAGGTQISALYSVSTEGDVKQVTVLDGAAVDVMSLDSRKIAVVTSPSVGTFKLLELYRAGTGWAINKSTVISNGLDMDYFDCYYMNGQYIIAARARAGERYDALVFYTFEVGGDAMPHYYGGSDENMLTPYAVIPSGTGYVAVCKRAGEGVMVTVDYAFTSYRRDSIGIRCLGASMLYSGGKYYASFTTATNVVTYEIDDRYNRRTIGGLVDVPYAVINNDGSPVFVTVTDGAVTITDCGTIKVALDISGARLARIIRVGYKELIIVLSATGGGALSVPTGGADVYAISVML